MRSRLAKGRRRLDAHGVHLHEDFSEGDATAAIAAGATLADLFPVGGRGEIRGPEGPGAALPGAAFVDAALASLIVEEHAIAVGVFDQALADADDADIATLELLDAEADGGGHRFDFGLINPDVAGVAGATIAAAGAGKFQALMIPRFAHGRIRSVWGLMDDCTQIGIGFLLRRDDRKISVVPGLGDEYHWFRSNQYATPSG